MTVALVTTKTNNIWRNIPSGMHSRTAIRFYEIHTPLTEAVLTDGRNYKCLCVISYYEEKRRK
jgi:hypothetical protein